MARRLWVQLHLRPFSVDFSRFYIMQLWVFILWFQSNICSYLFIMTWKCDCRMCFCGTAWNKSKARSGKALCLGGFNCPVIGCDLDHVGNWMLGFKRSGHKGLSWSSLLWFKILLTHSENVPLHPQEHVLKVRSFHAISDRLWFLSSHQITAFIFIWSAQIDHKTDICFKCQATTLAKKGENK